MTTRKLLVVANDKHSAEDGDLPLGHKQVLVR